MLVKGNYLEKEKVVFCKETDSIKSVLITLYESGYRCIPVLDSKGEKYVGNVYKVHILEYEKTGLMDLPVSRIVKNKDAFIQDTSSFFNIFFTIKELPFLAVVNEEKSFLGILPHSKVFELLEDSWGYKNGSATFTIGTMDFNGALEKILKLVRKNAKVQSVLTIDNDSVYLRRVLVTLHKDTSGNDIEIVHKRLEEAGFRVVYVEKYF